MSEHLSKQFNLELENLRTRVLQMGGMVEAQVTKAIDAFYSRNIAALEEVIHADAEVNRLEVELDEACHLIIARRQPTASDLRMIVTVMKSIADLERIGDKARKVARIGLSLFNQPGALLPEVDLRHTANLSLTMLRTALDAFARLDDEAATSVMRLDVKVNSEYRAVMRQTVTYMMEDPRTISRALELLNAAKAIERIGDHAKDISEYVIYMVRGLNVRHASLEEIERKLAPKGNGEG